MIVIEFDTMVLGLRAKVVTVGIAHNFNQLNFSIEIVSPIRWPLIEHGFIQDGFFVLDWRNHIIRQSVSDAMPAE